VYQYNKNKKLVWQVHVTGELPCQYTLHTNIYRVYYVNKMLKEYTKYILRLK